MTLKIQGISVITFDAQDVWHFHGLGPRAEMVYSLLLGYEELHIKKIISLLIKLKIMELALLRITLTRYLKSIINFI